MLGGFGGGGGWVMVSGGGVWEVGVGVGEDVLWWEDILLGGVGVVV